MFYVKVPPERIAILLGREGWAKRRMERDAGVKVIVDSVKGEVTVVTPDGASEMGMRVRDAIQAIAIGFAPDKARILLEEDTALELVDIHDFSGKKQTHIRRLRARVIGRNGKTRKMIEELAEVHIAISETVVGVIGGYEEVHDAARALGMILGGSEHRTAYGFLERQRRGRRLAILDSVSMR